MARDTKAIREQYNHPAVLDLCDEVDRLTALLVEAEDLLSTARFSMTDIGLHRSWAQRRRRFRDTVIEMKDS